MTTYWYCDTCETAGGGDREAEQHTRTTGHTTTTYARPRTPRMSIPFTLTDAGWALASEGWTT